MPDPTDDDSDVRLRSRPTVPVQDPGGGRQRLTVSLDDDTTHALPRPGRLAVDVEPRVSVDARDLAPSLVVSFDDLEPSRTPTMVALRRRPSAAPSTEVLRVGSSADCDVVINHPVVSPVHLELRNTERGPLVVDVSHGNAKLVVNGRFVHDSYLREGDRVNVGPAQFVVHDRQLLAVPSPVAAPLLTAYGVSVVAGDRQILHPTWLAVRPGELVAMIGESGAGKSTLLKLLAGVNRPATGAVLVGDEPLATRRTEIGYVPQDEIVHPSLTVREALMYAARLRLPQDSTNASRQQAVEQVLAEVGLERHADTQIGALSGGQRKRTGVATELVSRPRILFLDEPTTGLDPGLESKMMHLFRDLANGGRGVVLVTHAIQNLPLCDRLVVMARGGQVAYSGPPDGARAFFGIERLDDLYEKLDEAPEGYWHAKFLGGRTAEGWNSPVPAQVAAGSSAAPPPAGGVARQTATLLSRYVRLFLRDRRTLISTLVQAPLFGIVVAILFKDSVFDIAEPGQKYKPGEVHAAQSAQLLFLLITIAFWFGAFASAREIVKERAVVARELDVGVRALSYLSSKVALLFTIVAAQTMAFAFIVLTLRPMHEPTGVYFWVSALMVLIGCTAVAMGLLVSVFSSSEDQASSFMPALLVPQLLFGGAVVALEQMGSIVGAISHIAPVQWAFAGAGTAIDVQARGKPDPAFVANYGKSFFDVPPAVASLVLLAFIFGLMWIVGTRVRKLRSSG